MLPELHVALQRLLWERGHISAREVDINFEAPTRERIEKLTRPTINLFLFDVQENTDLRQTNWQVTRANGHAERRLPPRRIDLRYMVSALTTEIEDEHALLWRTLATLMKYPELPIEVLPDALRSLETPLAARTGQADQGLRLLDVWSALGTPPHPALQYVVTAPVDLGLSVESPLMLTRAVRYGRMPGSDVAPETDFQISGVVRNEKGVPLAGVTVAVEGSAAEGSVTNGEGWFTLRHVPPGTIRLRASRPDGSQQLVRVEVPGNSYDIVLNPAPGETYVAGGDGHRKKAPGK